MHRRTFLQTAAATAVLAGGGLPGLSWAQAAASGDPLLDPWTGDHGGVPPFDKITADAIKPALTKGMELARADIAAIAGHADAPNFENTIAALERAGQQLDRVGRIYNIYTSVLNDKQMQALDAEMSPILSAFDDEITQNEALFARIKTVHEGREAAGLTPEQIRLVETIYRNYVRYGAALGATEKARLKDLNQQLATLYTKFGQNVLADEENDALILESEADLEGLSDSLRAAAKASAEARGQAGKWLIANTRSSMEPFLTFSARRDLREKGWRMWIGRGDKGGATDNKEIISQILVLRSERAKLLGFPTHAHWATDNNMAKTPEAALDLMMKVWTPAVARARVEIADMQAVADAEKAGIDVEAWDYRYYAEKVRKAKYDIDENEVKPYLQLDKVREGMFWASGTLFGLDFTKLDGITVYHPDVTVYEVTRAGRRVGLWYFDPYARGGKRSGAWMNAYRTQARIDGEVTPIVSNNSNFVKGGESAPALLSWDDASTMFHEFGHALHGLCSNVTYPSLAGTAVKRDFVEFPSQITERWLPTPEVLNTFALHVETGAPMPPELLAKIETAKNANQGFTTVEYLASAIYDMKIHLAATTDAKIDPGAFEKSCLDELGMPAEIVMRHRPTQFGHTFSGDGYSAGYYVYLWADALSADAFEVFAEKGVFDKPTAQSFLDTILSVGNSIPPDEAFRRFRGRDVDTQALMRDRGFA
jgi:peptidyl-dipeptidase Dcp